MVNVEKKQNNYNDLWLITYNYNYNGLIIYVYKVPYCTETVLIVAIKFLRKRELKKILNLLGSFESAFATQLECAKRIKIYRAIYMIMQFHTCVTKTRWKNRNTTMPRKIDISTWKFVAIKTDTHLKHAVAISTVKSDIAFKLSV